MKSIDQADTKSTFTRYQVFVIALLAILQFTIILDFMVLSPLGTILMDELSLTPSRFGIVVSAYAFSAGISGLLAAGFADRFDRKKMLLFFYTGFLFGTFFCAMAPTFELLLIARIVTGIFGGVIGSIGFAIITDLFPMEKRGRVMGFVQMAFSASQILGLPIGLYLATKFGWHSPFWMIAFFGVAVGVIIYLYLKPIDTHLQVKSEASAFTHLWKTLSKRDYIRGFLATVLLATGGWMLMPFGSRFTTNNLGIDVDDLPMIYLITGVSSIIAGPLIGKLSDVSGKFNMFLFGSILSIVMVAVYTPLGITPLWLVILLNVILFVGILARIITSSAMLTAVPLPQDRGAFMSINSSIQQLSGGVASTVAGMIVIPDENDKLLHYEVLGYVVIGSILVALWMMHLLNRHIQRTQQVPSIPS
jgi:multidrug resistance protein